jgi:hypothetical protein
VFLTQLLLFLQLLLSMIYCFVWSLQKHWIKVSLYILHKAMLCPLQFCLLNCVHVCVCVCVCVCMRLSSCAWSFTCRHTLCSSKYSGMVLSVRGMFIFFLTCIFLSYFLAAILESSFLLQC